MGILKHKKIVLLNYPLGLSLLKYRNVWVFWNKKKSGSNRYNPLNSSIEYRYFLGNVLMEVRIAFLPNYHLILSLHKYRGVGVFSN